MWTCRALWPTLQDTETKTANTDSLIAEYMPAFMASALNNSMAYATVGA